MRSPPYPLSLLRTPACPGFGVFGDRKSSCFDRSGRLGAVKGESGLMGRSGDAASKRLYPVDRDAGAGSGSFERVQMGGPKVDHVRMSGGRPEGGLCPVGAGWLGGLKVGEMRTSGGRPEDGSCPNCVERVNGLGLFERVQMRMVAGEGPAPGGSFGAAAAAPFERVQMSLLGGSVDGDDTDSRRCAMQLRK